jgi:hypothetical protein
VVECLWHGVAYHVPELPDIACDPQVDAVRRGATASWTSILAAVMSMNGLVSASSTTILVAGVRRFSIRSPDVIRVPEDQPGLHPDDQVRRVGPKTRVTGDVQPVPVQFRQGRNMRLGNPVKQ